jgi:hypothetical protein
MPVRQIPEHERMRPMGWPVRKTAGVLGIVAVTLAVFAYGRIAHGGGGARIALALIVTAGAAHLLAHELRRDVWLNLRYDLMVGMAEMFRWPTTRKVSRLYWPFSAKRPGYENVTEPIDPGAHVQLDFTSADSWEIRRIRLGKRTSITLRRALVITFDEELATAVDVEADEIIRARREIRDGRVTRRHVLGFVVRGRITAARAMARSREQSGVRLRSLGRPRKSILLKPGGRAERVARHPRWWPQIIRDVRYTKVPPAFPWAERRMLEKIAAQTGALLGMTFYVRADAQNRTITLRATLPLPVELDYDELPSITGKVVIARAEPDPDNTGITWLRDADGRNVAYVAFDPNEFPHGRVHGPTGRGKTVLLRAFVHAWHVYGASLILIDGKRAGSFVYFLTRRFAGRCHVPGLGLEALREAKRTGRIRPALRADIDAKIDALRVAYDTLMSRQTELEIARLERHVLLDEGTPEAQLPPLPWFEPTTIVIDEWRAFARDCDLLDAADNAALGKGEAGQDRTGFLRLFAAQMTQLGRELGMFFYIASQTAQVEGVGGAKLDAETRSQFTLIAHLGPVGNTSDANTVFGTGEGISAWALSLDLKPYGRGGVKLGDAIIRCHFPYSHDPLASLARDTAHDAGTTYAAVLARHEIEQRSVVRADDHAHGVGARVASTTASTTATTAVLDKTAVKPDTGDLPDTDDLEDTAALLDFDDNDLSHGGIDDGNDL